MVRPFTGQTCVKPLSLQRYFLEAVAKWGSKTLRGR